MSEPKKAHGVEAVNQEYIRYDQVEKAHTYHLAEDDQEDQFDEEFEIKTCDLDQFLNGGDGGRERFAQEFGSALEEIGFAIIEGHGVDTTLHDAAVDKVIECFTKPTLDEKNRFRAARHGSVSQGYFPIKETSDIHPDLVEGWVFCRRAFDIPQERTEPFRAEDYWPIAELEPFFRQIVLQHEKLILPLMQSAFRYLGVDPHHYDEKMTGTNFGLRLNYYPPVSKEDDESGAGRLLGHEDVDIFTILPAPEVEGLQAFNRKTGK